MTILLSEKKVRTPRIKLLTYDDYAKLTPPDSGNYELHNGQIIYMPTPIPKHQKISGKLHYLLFGHILAHKLGEVYAAPMDTKFTEHDTVQPDLLFIAQDRLSIIGDKKIEGAPDFIIEIHSPGNTAKDMSYKKHLYESFDVKEYWVVYPAKNIIKQYENYEGEFVLVRQYGKGDVLQSIVIQGFVLNVSDIFI